MSDPLPSLDDFTDSSDLPSVDTYLKEEELPSVDEFVEEEEEKVIEEATQTLEDAEGNSFVEVKDIVPPWPELIRLVNDLRESIPEIPEIKSYDKELEELTTHIKEVQLNIPIIPESEVKAANPDYMVVFPWHFRHGILQREREYRNSGGKLIFPLPHIEIV